MPLNAFKLRELFNQPVLLSEREAEFFKGCLGVGLEHIKLLDKPDDYLASLEIDGKPVEYGNTGLFGFGQNQVRPYPIVNGFAVIDINGVLLCREPWWGYSYTGYESIVMRARMAAEDEQVKGILFRFYSGGGMVAGCFEACDDLKLIAEEKPIWSLVSPWCCSAAYALASATNKIYVTPSGQAGSVGVLLMHVEFSKVLEDFGVKVTLVHAGKHKVDGNPFEPLPDAVRKKWQGQINKLYELFTATVAENRGLSVDAVKQTEADVFDADDLIKLGLADEIGVDKDVLGQFEESLEDAPDETDEPDESDEDTTMSEPTDKDKAKAAAEKANQQAAEQAAADAKKAERERIAAIRGSEEAKGRESLADHLAFETEMSADDAVAALKASPKLEEKPPAPKGDGKTPFEKAMEKDNPNIDPEGSGDIDDKDEADEMAAAYDEKYRRKTA